MSLQRRGLHRLHLKPDLPGPAGGPVSTRQSQALRPRLPGVQGQMKGRAGNGCRRHLPDRFPPSRSSRRIILSEGPSRAGSEIQTIEEATSLGSYMLRTVPRGPETP